MSLLSQISCLPPQPGESAITDAEIAELHPFVPSWQIIREEGVRKLRHTFLFDDDETADAFLNHLGKIAARENHHPETERSGSIVMVEWWTHTLSDLHPNDFIMAAKTEGAFTLALVGEKGDMLTDEPLPTLFEVPRFSETVEWRQLRKGA